MSQKSGHSFGGNWTEQKLDMLRQYLCAYTTIMKEQPFTFAYIDAFAGTGYRTNTEKTAETSQLQLGLEIAETQKWLDGSALIALQTTPPFKHYLFIEQNKERCAELASLKTEFSSSADAIQIIHGEANAEIKKICSKNWKKHRAVLFLDPYGMEVEWNTLEAVAATKAIDLWLLFPLGIGVNRLLTNNGQISEGWAKRLSSIFGEPEDAWRGKLYRPAPTQASMFDPLILRIEKVAIEEISQYFVQRLQTIFPAVAPNPRILCNSRNSPLYLLCFAAGNKRGGPTALKIADYILTKG